MKRLQVISKGMIQPIRATRLENDKKWKGENMRTETPKIEPETDRDTFRAISLFMKWFLRNGEPAKEGYLDMWLSALKEAKKEDRTQWKAFIRLDLVSSALPTLRSILERPLTDPERTFLDAAVEQFIEESVQGNDRVKS